MTAASANDSPNATPNASKPILTQMAAGMMTFADDPESLQQEISSAVSGPSPSLAHGRASESLQRIQSGASELLRFSRTLPENYGQTHDATSAALLDGPLSKGALQAMAKLSNDIASGVGEIAALSRNSAEPNEKRKTLHNDQQREPKSHKASSRRRQSSVRFACHACHRVETPQWRPGPGGPGTLCNVCGLVYARRERKRQTGSQCPS
ncbi:hypothetical protein SODALDRAFT_67546 [Sodiomyces alkalinus F11]|uniref:GATA-type domain-containing protein n=1 Tax=Sodiomyces alkalinus (strain CBS 110278 / VKM F-3762 / F11) TaxID=1314773 RepID=A0A3N2PLS4_SODAK|nr:hypothetical protein SODALDRAFT_67546 [Sodiomyces alkalinus F11]ROT35481.1 hypothetical protein SODALDRAFT_67546 [Sodiomyces alkalinus F11]